MVSRIIAFAGIFVLIAAGLFAFFDYTSIAYLFLAVSCIDLLGAIILHPGEHDQPQQSKKMKAANCLLVVGGTAFIYITNWWIGVLLIWFGLQDLIFGKHSIFKRAQKDPGNTAAVNLERKTGSKGR